MRFRRAVAALVLAAGGCATTHPAPAPLAPLAGEGEVHVFLLPLPREAGALAFGVEAVALRTAAGADVPLERVTARVDGAAPGAQRHLAWGRVPPGEYVGLALRLADASIGRDGARVRQLVGAEPVHVERALRVVAGRAGVVWLALDRASARAGYDFVPTFTATLPPLTPPQVALYVTQAGGATVWAVDRRAKLVTGVVALGGEPGGVALDRDARRAWIALGRDDRVEVVDPAAAVPIATVRLAPGDRPREVGTGADGTLVVVNAGSRSVALVDPVALVEVTRLPTGDEPASLLLDRGGRRAYVASRGSARVTVVDLGTRSLAGSIPTEAEPLWADLSRDGGRLYVVHRGSAYLAAFDVATLAPAARTYVGLGVTTVLVDPRTDLVYLSRGEERRITVHDPVSLQQLDVIEAPGAVSRMAIDEAERTLLALVPERRALVVFDLTSRRQVAEIPAGAAPFAFALAGARP